MSGVRSAVLGVIAAIGLAALGAAPAGAARPDCDAARQTVQREIEAACPCDTAKNHAEYVRCVTKKLRTLSECTTSADGTRTCGPLPRACFGSIRKLASRSACGDDAGVTCCVPRPRDCVGDAHPGDGKAEGLCSGTTHPCDRIADCSVPKCSVAPNEERCRLRGGTVGRGKDCSTACAP